MSVFRNSGLISGATPPLMSFSGCGNGLKKARICGASGGASVLAYAAGGRSGADAGKGGVGRAARPIKVCTDENARGQADTNGSISAFVMSAGVAGNGHL